MKTSTWMMLVGYPLVAIALAVWLGWKDRRKQKRRHKELVSKLGEPVP